MLAKRLRPTRARDGTARCVPLSFGPQHAKRMTSAAKHTHMRLARS